LLLLCPLAAKKLKPRLLLLLPRHQPLLLLLRPLLLLKLPSLLKPLLLLRPLTRSNLCFLEKRGKAPFFFALNFW
jgi:hypothetical protein